MNPDEIVLVSGLPRSGTSMMMQILAAGGIPVLTDNLRMADADNPRGYYEFEPVKNIERDASWLNDARGKAVKLVSALLRFVPGEYPCRVIFMRRDLDEVLASQRQMLLRRRESTSRDDTSMAELFRRHLRHLEAWLQAQPHLRALWVDYNSLVAHPEDELTRINTFLDGRLDLDAAREVVDRNLHRHRQQ
ncbi:sulfotransferase [Candidatus Binatia bacterium]|nr:sulfotransferase [Candidatus Binatia bacterium]